MDNLLRLLLRFIIVPLGMICGFIASFLVILFGYWRVGDLLAGNVDVEAIALYDALAAASYLLMMVVLAMWAVALIGILFAEAFAVRSWMFHVASGTVSAFLGTQLYPVMMGEPAPLADPFYILATGLAGGLVYWLVAGWGAGFWKTVLAAPRAPQSPPPSP